MSVPQSGREAQEESATMIALGLETGHGTKAPASLVDRMREAASLLAECAGRVSPDPSVKSRLTTRIAQYERYKPLADVRPYDGEWVNPGIAGVELRKLFEDKSTGRTTMLVRMDPGVRFPSHYHHDDEQCLVIDGDIGWGELVYRKGDFVVMGKATTHPEIWTRDGNLLLIVAGRNEFLKT